MPWARYRAQGRVMARCLLANRKAQGLHPASAITFVAYWPVPSDRVPEPMPRPVALVVPSPVMEAVPVPRPVAVNEPLAVEAEP